MPNDYTYRKETETLINERASVIKNSGDIAEAEQKIGMGQIEEVIIQVSLCKRYSKIYQHLARHFKNNGACLSSPPLFLCSQIITSFSNSMIYTNQEAGL